jgi:hypothetical protein
VAHYNFQSEVKDIFQSEGAAAIYCPHNRRQPLHYFGRGIVAHNNRDRRNDPRTNGLGPDTNKGTFMSRTILALSATAALLAACGNNDAAEAPVEGPAVSSPESPVNPAVDTQDTAEQSTLTPGANSFTEGQAREAIEKQGYTVSGPLTQDEQGIWKGQASRSGGAATTVSVDYKGVVTAE